MKVGIIGSGNMALSLINGFRTEKKNKIISGYGAAAKTSSILNFCDLNENHIKFVFDKSQSKINKYIPGTKIKICSPNIKTFKNFDILIIFVWNLKNEILREIKKFNIKKKKIYVLSPTIKRIN